MAKSNKYEYEVNNGKRTGYFKIYQGKSGKVFLMMGSNVTPLTLEQVNDLGIDVYSLLEFSYDDFKNAYQI